MAQPDVSWWYYIIIKSPKSPQQSYTGTTGAPTKLQCRPRYYFFIIFPLCQSAMLGANLSPVKDRALSMFLCDSSLHFRECGQTRASPVVIAPYDGRPLGFGMYCMFLLLCALFALPR